MYKKTTLWFLLLCALPAVAQHTQTDSRKDESVYLAGAVPEVDGKVVFSKEFLFPGQSRAAVYDLATEWINRRLGENKNAESRLVYTNEAEGTLAGIGQEWLVFSSSALSLDRTLLNYQITATCRPGTCLIALERIRYTYRETEKYKAEEWIADKYALNKEQTKLVRGLAKWRRKTVDFANELFTDAAIAFGQQESSSKVLVKKAVVPALPAEGPVVIAQPAQSIGAATYVEADLSQIPGAVYALMGSGKLVVSIGKDEFDRTTMTAGAGGALGYRSGKAVAYCSLSPEQPYEALEKAELYQLKLYPADSTTPAALIECRKLPEQAAPQSGQSRTYVGEILKLLVLQP